MKTLPEQTSLTPVSEEHVLDFSVNEQPNTVKLQELALAQRQIQTKTQSHVDGLESGASNQPAQADSPPPPRMGKHCRFVIAAAIFIAANLALSFSTPIDFDPYRFIYRGWAWWTMQDLKNDTEIHNVALLGSSLIVSAIAGSEANHLSHSLDMTSYHKSTYLDYLLHNNLKGDFNTFNLSAPGQMPSDAYLTLKAMVNVSQRPEVVIYGIAPRDFIDSQLSSPVDTEPFRYLRRIVNIDDVATGLYRSPIPRLDWCLQHSVYMYGNSLDLQMNTDDAVKQVMAQLVPQPVETQRPFTWWDRTRILPNYLPGEIIPNSMLATPVTQAEVIAQYTDNTAEYKERYKRPDPSIYQTQFYFLRKLAAYCKREKIELVLVNMPITQTNINLLNPSVYLQYVQAIRNFSYGYNIAFLDMCTWSDYTKADFHDSVHLNAWGGKKFLCKLVSALSGVPRTRQALHLAGEELHRHRQVASQRAVKPGEVE